MFQIVWIFKSCKIINVGIWIKFYASVKTVYVQDDPIQSVMGNRCAGAIKPRDRHRLLPRQTLHVKRRAVTSAPSTLPREIMRKDQQVWYARPKKTISTRPNYQGIGYDKARYRL